MATLTRAVAALLIVGGGSSIGFSSAFSSFPLPFATRSSSSVTSVDRRHRNAPVLATPTDDATIADADADTDTESPTGASPLLPDLFPTLSGAISSLGFSAPTPIQSASADRALSGENLLLVAPTGSGKTLSYLLPAVTRAMEEDGTVLIVAPTRELAVQLMRDSVDLLSGLTEDAGPCVRLAVDGVDIPASEELDEATILIGTPKRLYDTLKSVEGGTNFVSGDTLSAVILDEVDVLLPPTPKHLRTALDSVNKDGGRGRRSANSAQDERRRKEQKRKLLAAKRRGVQMNDDKRIISDTERILGLVASNRMMGRGGEDTSPAQVLAGSATASRKALDRLNAALRSSASSASIPFALTWSGDAKMCRPDEDDASDSSGGGGGAKDTEADTEGGEQQQQQPQHTIRAVTVPKEVSHRYIELSKDDATSPSHVLNAVANAAAQLKPETALVFLCGEFGKPTKAAPARPLPKIKGATSKARRNAMRKQRENAAKALFKQHQKGGKKKAGAEGTGLSARKACKMLKELGIDAQPLHVALGLELNAKEGEDDDREDTPPFLVTFEGSARGLHFDNVDAVFVLGRPSSAAAYLHLAGRVGRASADEDGNVVIRPGTVVSVCTRGSAGELEKWTRSIGGNALEELVL